MLHFYFIFCSFNVYFQINYFIHTLPTHFIQYKTYFQTIQKQHVRVHTLFGRKYVDLSDKYQNSAGSMVPFEVAPCLWHLKNHTGTSGESTKHIINTKMEWNTKTITCSTLVGVPYLVRPFWLVRCPVNLFAHLMIGLATYCYSAHITSILLLFYFTKNTYKFYYFL